MALLNCRVSTDCVLGLFLDCTVQRGLSSTSCGEASYPDVLLVGDIRKGRYASVKLASAGLVKRCKLVDGLKSNHVILNHTLLLCCHMPMTD